MAPGIFLDPADIALELARLYRWRKEHGQPPGNTAIFDKRAAELENRLRTGEVNFAWYRDTERGREENIDKG